MTKLRDNENVRKGVAIITFCSSWIEPRWLKHFYNPWNDSKKELLKWWIIWEICGAVASAGAVWFTPFFLPFSNEPSLLSAISSSSYIYTTLLLLLCTYTCSTTYVARSMQRCIAVSSKSVQGGGEAVRYLPFCPHSGGGEEYQLAMRGLEKQN